jgi:hypothetical protein
MYEVTKKFVEIVHLRWAISIGLYDGFEPAYKPYELDGLDLTNEEGICFAVSRLKEKEAEFLDETERLAEQTTLHKSLDEIGWIFDDDPSSRVLQNAKSISGNPSSISVMDEGSVLFNGWDGWQEFWKVQVLDTEGAEIALHNGKVTARKVFRGFIYRSALCAPGKRYQAVVPFQGKVGPSSNVYIRLDFSTEDFCEITGSKWDRIPPGTYHKPFMLGPSIIAPEQAAYMRLYIRLCAQEEEDWLEIGKPCLIEVSDES